MLSIALFGGTIFVVFKQKMLTHYCPSKFCQHNNVLRHHYKSNVLFFIIRYFSSLPHPHIYSQIMHFQIHKWLYFLAGRSCSRPSEAGGGGGAESKLKRMDWYSGQTAGMLLKASFKPNVHRPLKSARTSLLNQKPTSGCVSGLQNYWLAGSQTRWRKSGDVDTYFWWEKCTTDWPRRVFLLTGKICIDLAERKKLTMEREIKKEKNGHHTDGLLVIKN